MPNMPLRVLEGLAFGWELGDTSVKTMSLSSFIPPNISLSFRMRLANVDGNAALESTKDSHAHNEVDLSLQSQFELIGILAPPMSCPERMLVAPGDRKSVV